ncbi:MAG: nuclear transport factor 2 family protein [Gammaproteobacteria bacterium]|uniref:nuclear transport factor 2 family protein n=1 Tax=Pseudomaricurvus alcaniphilus TaxID=1166482 RepID=UPI00140BDD71|nr:nuclear transport factor 2 family protein [Pseudomaricurvus alcaniphilus]MBR9911064.1 nuclear transport factor 2 family protein [Gammaproteobacteria bacterium]NHN36432.1 nuclear transport factor 2 family protein [Pseudomaricurvus alcaniphilus]
MSTEVEKAAALTKAAMGISEGLPLVAASEGGVEELRRDIQRLMDMEAIKQVKHAYFRCIDTANWDELHSVCHPELKVHYVGGGYEYKMTSREEFLLAMQMAFHSEAVTRHNGVMPEIQMLSETEATGIWYLYDHFWSLNVNQLTEGTALYWDRYVKLDGRWVIKETSYRRIYQINQKLTEKPGLASHYLADHGKKLNR